MHDERAFKKYIFNKSYTVGVCAENEQTFLGSHEPLFGYFCGFWKDVSVTHVEVHSPTETILFTGEKCDEN